MASGDTHLCMDSRALWKNKQFKTLEAGCIDPALTSISRPRHLGWSFVENCLPSSGPAVGGAGAALARLLVQFALQRVTGNHFFLYLLV